MNVSCITVKKRTGVLKPQGLLFYFNKIKVGGYVPNVSVCNKYLSPGTRDRVNW
jgi:hypothetical protein